MECNEEIEVCAPRCVLGRSTSYREGAVRPHSVAGSSASGSEGRKSRENAAANQPAASWDITCACAKSLLPPTRRTLNARSDVHKASPARDQSSLLKVSSSSVPYSVIMRGAESSSYPSTRLQPATTRNYSHRIRASLTGSCKIMLRYSTRFVVFAMAHVNRSR